MRKALALATLLLVFTASNALAGHLSPGLQRLITGKPGSDEIKVLVVLQDQADIPTLNQNLHLAHAPRALRHRIVVDALRETAARSQAPLRTELASKRANGAVREFAPWWIVNAFTVTTTVDGVRELAARSDVDVIEPDLPVDLIRPVNVGKSDSGNAIDQIGIVPGIVSIGARRVWTELGINGTGALIGGLDTGVDGTHPALSARWRGHFAPVGECWRDAVGFGDTTPVDRYGHGTHTMGTMCGLAPTDTIGVAPGAQWISDNAINQSTGAAFDADIIDAFQWFADPDGNSNTLADVPDVVQNSWGVNEGFSGYVDCDTRWWVAIDNCEAAGVCVTWSAGNEGPGAQTMRSPADRATTPFNTFSVGATNPTSPFTIASFSSRGPSGCGGPYAMKPEISAPGVGIYSSVPGGGYQNMDGTSMAGPHVAGTVALMRSANPNVDVDTIKQILMDTAVDLGTPGEDNTYGHGFLNAFDAVVAVLQGYGQIQGTVTDATFHTPIANASIQVIGDPRHTTTNGSGFYQFSLPAGPWTLEYSAPGYITSQQVVQVTDGGIANGDFAMPRVPDSNASVDPTSLTENLPPGGTGQQQLTVINSGGGTLTYTVSLMNAPAADHGPSRQNGTADPADGGPAKAASNGGPTILGSGGPDAFGHYYIDSDDPYGPTYAWVELAGLGQQYLLGDNSYTTSIPMGITFPFYGNNYTGVHVSSNGFVSFTAPGGVYNVNASIPTAAQPNDVVAAFWDDLNPLDGGAVYVYSDVANSRFIVEWRQVPRFGTSGLEKETCELILNSNGTIVLQYQSVANPTSATVGIENATGADGLQLTYNQAYLHNNLAILISMNAPVPWLSVSPFSDTVNPFSSGLVTASYNANPVPVGTYHAVIRLRTNDPFHPVIDVPVTLNVGTGTGVLAELAPDHFELGAPHPNPSGAATSVQYAVPAGAKDVRISVFDVAGRHVRTLVSGAPAAGRYTANWDGRDVAGHRVVSGVYFYRMDAGTFSQVRKVTILK